MPTFPELPDVANETNYPAGANPWSSTPTKVDPGSGLASYGLVPGTKYGAQHFNYLFNSFSEGVKDSQKRHAVKVVASGRLDSDSFGAFLPHTQVFVGAFDNTGTSSVGALSPDFKRTSISATSAGNNNERAAIWKSSTAATAILFNPGNTLGGSGALLYVQDTKARAVTSAVAPTSNTNYIDGCTDETTGRAVILSGSTLAPGMLSGNPNVSLTFVAPTGSTSAWSATDVNARLASKPGEVRAWSRTNLCTFASSNGGVTVGSIQTLVFSGGLTSTSQMSRPCWDSIRSRWICSTYNFAVDANTAYVNAKVWTSTDGVTFEELGDTEQLSITHIAEHSGMLFAIARIVESSAGVGHGGLEVVFSVDGGTTWERPNIVLSFAIEATFAALTNRKYTEYGEIIKMGDNHIAFMSALDVNGASYVVGSKGTEYVVLQTGY